MQGDTYRSENVIFTDLRFPEKAEGETSPLYERAYFKVEDVEAYDEVKENLQKVDINWEQYDLIDNNGNSETMSSNFNDLAKVSEMMILVISVASFVILVLVFLFWRKIECRKSAFSYLSVFRNSELSGRFGVKRL